MRFEITEGHIIDVPDSELGDGERPLSEIPLEEILGDIKENSHWFIEQYGREAWCEEVTRLGRQL